MKGKICIIGKTTEVKFLKSLLEEKGLEIVYFPKLELSEEKINPSAIDVLIYELSYEETKSTEILNRLFKTGFKVVIFLAEKADLVDAVEFIKKGAYDFKLLSTPIELIEKTIIYALEDKRFLWQEEEFLTKNSYMIEILKKLEKIAQTKVPILFIGESGTGKELLSKYVHQISQRRYGPFVAINCAALPETLLESELFGYEKGAFSGANFRKKGKIELADGGTLLLDEITEMSPNLQAKLLRVLQEGEVDRLGGYHPIKVDVRIISTTNRDIKKEVEEGRFRLDLYYRINVITIKIPPLRERKEDIVFLANFFLEKFSRIYGKDIRGFSKDVLEFFEKYDFPGNVRELKNMIERAVLTCEEPIITLKNLLDPLSLEENLKKPQPELSKIGIKFDIENKETLIKPLEELEREAILKALEIAKGNKSKAAELLGITVRTLRNKLKQYKELGLI